MASASKTKRAVNNKALTERNPTYAGQSVKQGNYTVSYGQNGNVVKAVKDGGASATVQFKTTHANDSPYHQAAYEAAQKGNWDEAGRIMNQYSEQFGQTGEPGVLNLKPANDYLGELKNEFSYNANDYYRGRYDSVYGEGAWDGGTGTGKPVFNEYSQYLVDQYNKAGKTPTSGAVMGQTSGQAVGTNGLQGSVFAGMQTGENAMNPYGAYGSFDEFLSEMGYSDYADATQQAIRAAVQQAINGYNQQIESTNEDSEELARQAYINMMMGGKNLDQQLAASGYAGGMADSQRIALQANYENDLNALERQRVATINELQRAITNAQLTGDMQTAQELASYLQQVQGQWNNYVMNQQQMANDNYWRQQSIDADNQNRAREMALMIMQSGGMPDDETLSAAGISRAQAQALLGTTGQPVATPVRTGGGYNNGSLTSQQVRQMQQALGVTVDGLWGSNSSRAAGGLTADEAWAAYQQAQIGQQPVTQVPNGIIAEVQSRLMEEGYSADRLSSILENLMARGRITEDQAMAVAAHFGWK